MNVQDEKWLLSPDHFSETYHSGGSSAGSSENGIADLDECFRGMHPDKGFLNLAGTDIYLEVLTSGP